MEPCDPESAKQRICILLPLNKRENDDSVLLLLSSLSLLSLFFRLSLSLCPSMPPALPPHTLRQPPPHRRPSSSPLPLPLSPSLLVLTSSSPSPYPTEGTESNKKNTSTTGQEVKQKISRRRTTTTSSPSSAPTVTADPDFDIMQEETSTSTSSPVANAAAAATAADAAAAASIASSIAASAAAAAAANMPSSPFYPMLDPGLVSLSFLSKNHLLVGDTTRYACLNLSALESTTATLPPELFGCFAVGRQNVRLMISFVLFPLSLVRHAVTICFVAGLFSHHH